MQMGGFFCGRCGALSRQCPNKKPFSFTLNGFLLVTTDQAEGGGT